VGARLLASLAAALAVLAFAPAASAAPAIHAHRGGSVLDGVPAYPENTMPAFEHASAFGYVLELDVKLTKDGVPVVIHDDTVDRTTACTGAVNSFTRAQLAACKSDVLGSPGGPLPSKQVAPTVPIPTLAEVLAFAKREGAAVNMEIKNLPTDNDFDPGSGYANKVMDTVLASGIANGRLIVQSFWPPNLDVAKQRFPGVQTSLLTLAQANDGGPAFASSNGYDWVSPAWPVSASYVQQAHGLRRKVVPYTLDKQAEIKSAASIGVDAVITDDPVMAQRALGLLRNELTPDRSDPVVELFAPSYASNRSTSRRFRLRWRGTDRGSGIARYRLDVRVRSSISTRWRPVVRSTRRRSAAFRGHPGRAYLFRLRARDAFGNLSRYSYDDTVVPLDDRSRQVHRSFGWTRLHRRAAYGHSVIRVRRAGPILRLRFRGTRVAVIGTRSPRGGNLLVTVAGRAAVIRLRGRRRYRRVLYRSRIMRPGLHLLRVQALGGRADLDAFGVDTGLPPPRR
jgi:glycerophosphoryl diester phosphodiesterase